MGAAFTRSAKLVVALRPDSSVTVRVMVAVPVRVGSGVRVIVRASPTPPSAMPPAGTSSGSLAVAATVSRPGRVSTSFTSKRSAPVAAPLAMTTSASVVIVGGREVAEKSTPVAAGGTVALRFAGVKTTPPLLGVTVRAPGVTAGMR